MRDLSYTRKGEIGGIIIMAVAGLHLSGRAAERFAARHPARSMIAGDIIEQLPHVIPA
jgi:NAD(P)H-hydrate repair Nnr-like enzyme with NAD(P)H-hydrate dehydratase domain